MRARSLNLTLLAMFCLVPTAIWWRSATPFAQSPGQDDRFVGPTSSQPLALSANGSLLAVANPDNDTVTFFGVASGQSNRLAEVEVGREPNGVAVLPDGLKVYVANTVSGTVSVIKIDPGKSKFNETRKIKVGTEPYGLALTPNGTRLYVTNARSNSISVIDTDHDTVITTIEDAGFEPRGIAITNDGDGNDADETVYVTQFLSLPVPGKADGEDDAKVGKVTVISTGSNSVLTQVTLNPLDDTGFLAAGDAIARIAPATPPVFTFKTGAYPNQLNNIGIKGNFAFVPNTGASPNGPFRFNVNTQSLLSVIDRATNSDANQTINMHLAVGQSPGSDLFHTIPWALAFAHNSNEAFVLSAASNIVFKIVVDPATGAADVQLDPSDPTKVLQLQAGKNPRGIVINPDDTLVYVMNYVSRDVTVIDLTTQPEHVVGTLSSAALPAPGTVADLVHVGKELYNTSVGEFDPAVGTTTPIKGRMSAAGWGACAACHPNGLSDNVVWIFPSGPKRTIPQHTDFDLTDPERKSQRILNWSGERDEEEDFELNIRAVSGGQGLIVLADGVTQDPAVTNLGAPSGNRNQLKVHGVNAWDAIKAYIQLGVRPPLSPLKKTEHDVKEGRQLFRAANCQACHGGPQWTSSRVDFTPPPPATRIKTGQILDQLRIVGTFTPGALNEVNTNGAPSIGGDGFVPPSLLSLFAFPQTFFHNGGAATLEDVMDNVTHRTAGTSGVDVLSNEEDRRRLIAFLLSIDAETKPIDLPQQP